MEHVHYCRRYKVNQFCFCFSCANSGEEEQGGLRLCIRQWWGRLHSSSSVEFLWHRNVATMESNGFFISSPWRPMDSATCREGDKGTGCVTLAWPVRARLAGASLLALSWAFLLHPLSPVLVIWVPSFLFFFYQCRVADTSNKPTGNKPWYCDSEGTVVGKRHDRQCDCSV